ncbi:hypothetical protein QBC35DRAFT_477581 [Podospora australis]|uniref:Uncharacterized protein n=1 Tax=Podospora australis TaxID=1536484 RepID=A0AAN6WLI9_9PEZI|nr:hypothetical protein QBC35DRAFT_477581 [Podospora australis]
MNKQAEYATTPTGIAALPPEIVLKIFYECPDLETLYSFICSTPGFGELFECESVKILEAILVRLEGSRRSSVSIRENVLWIALMGGISITKEEFDKKLSAAAGLREPVRRRDLQKSNTFLQRLLKTLVVNTAGARRALVVANLVRTLENRVLGRMLDCALRVPARVPRDPGFSFNPDPAVARSEFPDFESLQDSPSARFKYTQPSWRERKKVRDVLWEMAISWEEHRTFKHGTKLPTTHRKQPRTATQRLIFQEARCTIHIDCSCLKDDIPRVPGSVYDCVYETLYDMFGLCPTAFFTGSVPPDRMKEARQRFSAQWSLVTERRHAALKRWNPEIGTDRCVEKWNWASYLYGNEYMWKTDGPQLHKSYTTKTAIGGFLNDRDLRVFSRLGFSVWDCSRLKSWGLCGSFMTLSDREAHAWRSVLIQEMESMPLFMKRRLATERCHEQVALWRKYRGRPPKPPTRQHLWVNPVCLSCEGFHGAPPLVCSYCDERWHERSSCWRRDRVEILHAQEFGNEVDPEAYDPDDFVTKSMLFAQTLADEPDPNDYPIRQAIIHWMYSESRRTKATTGHSISWLNFYKSMDALGILEVLRRRNSHEKKLRDHSTGCSWRRKRNLEARGLPEDYDSLLALHHTEQKPT